MKILKGFQINKILTIKLLKNQIYKKNKIELKKFKLQLTKIFKVLFKFYMLNKKILFLGVNRKFNNFVFNMLKTTKHSFVPSEIWFNGILTNSNIIFKYLVLIQNLRTFTKFLFNLNKTNLLVVYNFKSSSLNELLTLKVPTLAFNKKSNFFDYKLNFFSKTFNLPVFYFFFKVLKQKSIKIKTKNAKYK